MQDFIQLGRIGAIRQLYEDCKFKPFGQKGFTASSHDRIVHSSRLLLEGIDFDLVYFPLKHLGYKSVVYVTGELFASSATPESLELKLGISAKLDFARVRELWQGVVAAAEEFGYKSLSLDLQPSRNGLAISVAADGRCPASVSRNAPKPASKDLLCISGALGAAYLGLRLLEKGKSDFEAGKAPASGKGSALESNRMLVAAYLKPELPAGLPKLLKDSGITPSASCFVDRGLADAMLRLQRETCLGAKVYADRIPFEGNSFAVGKELDIDPVSAAMNGGDDCRVLLAVPIAQYEKFRHDFQAFDIIGHLAQPDAGAVLVTPDGLEHPVSAPDWIQQTNL